MELTGDSTGLSVSQQSMDELINKVLLSDKKKSEPLKMQSFISGLIYGL